MNTITTKATTANASRLNNKRAIGKQRGVTLVEMSVYMLVTSIIFAGTLILTKHIYESQTMSYLSGNSEAIDNLINNAQHHVNKNEIVAGNQH